MGLMFSNCVIVVAVQPFHSRWQHDYKLRRLVSLEGTRYGQASAMTIAAFPPKTLTDAQIDALARVAEDAYVLAMLRAKKLRPEGLTSVEMHNATRSAWRDAVKAVFGGNP